VISIISGDNVALLTGCMLAAFGRPEEIPEDVKVRASPCTTGAPPGTVTFRSPAAGRIAIPNLGMILPTECNVWINLRSMVRLVSMMKLIG